MATPYPGSEVKCGAGRGASVPWDFLPGLLVKAPPGPCLQAQRKEKSRNAARSRRGKENLEFFELSKLLPLPGAISSQLDKASIVRLSVTYLRLRRFAALGAPPWGLRAVGPPAGLGFAPGRRGQAALVSEVFEQHLGGHILQSLDGFVFALNQEGKFLYISETVSIYLGLSQVELTGSSVFDYIHPGDHTEVLEQLGLRARTPGPPTPPSVSSSSSSSSSSQADIPEIDASPAEAPPSARVQERSFFVRMKSTLTKRGLHVKASGYKVIHVTGRLRARALGLVALGHTLPPAPLAELPLHGHMIVFRLSLGLTILACESRVSDHMDLGPSELVGRSCYQFVHGQDATRIRQSHLDPMLRVARPLWTPSSFQPVQPVRGRPARGRSPPRGVRRQRGSRLRPQTRMMPPRPGASASKWSRGRGKPEAPRTVKARKLPSSRAQRGSPGSPQSSEARCGPGTRSPRATHRRCRQPCCPRASCRPWCAASAHPAPFATRPQSWASCARACLEPSALHLACPARGSGSRAPGRSTRGTENRCPGLKPAPLLCPPCRPRLSISPLPLLPLLSLLSPPGLVLLQSHLPQGTGATTLSPDLERRQLKF